MNSIATLTFFLKDTATTEIYTLSLHDALPISAAATAAATTAARSAAAATARAGTRRRRCGRRSTRHRRSEEHTSELQSHVNLVCRLLLEKKNNRMKHTPYSRGFVCYMIYLLSC